jgi:hypothetical protein
MPFIGKENLVGQYALIDAITPNGSTSYTLQIDGVNYEPESPRNLIVSVNGVTQAPVSSYTVSGSTITFAEAIQSSDSIDYILVLGHVLDIGVPSDNSVGFTQLKDGGIQTIKIADDQITTAKIADGNITNALMANNAIDTDELVDGAVTTAKLDATLSITNLTVSNTFTQGTGDYIQNRYVMHGTTTDDTETEIFCINTNGRIPVGANTTIFYEASFAARRTDASGESAAWHLKGCADNYSGTVADVGTVYEIAVAQDDVSLAVDIRADDTNDSVDVYVTGANNKSYSWTTVITTVEVSQ